MTKSILFLDFNGVLSYNKFWNQLESETHEYHHYWSMLHEYLFVKDRKLFSQWMLVELTSEKVHRIIEINTSISYEFLFPLFVEDCKTIDISESILDQIELLKEKYYCILATDNMDSLERYTLPAYPRIQQVFHQIDNSYHNKMFKKSNNGEYFLKRTREMNVPFSQCILIDDSKGICSIFESHDGQAFNVTGENNVIQALTSLA